MRHDILVDVRARGPYVIAKAVDGATRFSAAYSVVLENASFHGAVDPSKVFVRGNPVFVRFFDGSTWSYPSRYVGIERACSINYHPEIGRFMDRDGRFVIGAGLVSIFKDWACFGVDVVFSDTRPRWVRHDYVVRSIPPRD